MSVPFVACMGGWRCSRRNGCAHYHADDKRRPAERLCSPGTTERYIPVPDGVTPLPRRQQQRSG